MTSQDRVEHANTFALAAIKRPMGVGRGDACRAGVLALEARHMLVDTTDPLAVTVDAVDRLSRPAWLKASAGALHELLISEPVLPELSGWEQKPEAVRRHVAAVYIGDKRTAVHELNALAQAFCGRFTQRRNGTSADRLLLEAWFEVRGVWFRVWVLVQTPLAQLPAELGEPQPVDYTDPSSISTARAPRPGGGAA